MPTREQFKAQARAVRRMAAATREVDAAQIAQRREPSTTNKRVSVSVEKLRCGPEIGGSAEQQHLEDLDE